MALNVDYGPIGLFGAIAAQAGQNEGKWKQANLDMQAARMTQENIQQANQIAAQDRAHQLQAAMEGQRLAFAKQQAADQKMSPAAAHVSSYLDQQNQIRQQDKAASKAQLDDLLSKGIITQEGYGRALTGVLTGSKSLIDKAVLGPEQEAANQQAQQTASKAQLDDLLSKGIISPEDHAKAMTGLITGSKGLVERAVIGEKQTNPLQQAAFTGQLRTIRESRQQAYQQLHEFATNPITGKKTPVVDPDSDPGKALQAQIDKSYADEQGLYKQAAPKTPNPLSSTGGAGGMNPSQINDAMAKVNLAAFQLPPKNTPVTPGVGSAAAPQPPKPVTYPDATWNAQYNAWTVVRNSHLMKAEDPQGGTPDASP
jgi:hypothetical protein